MKRSVAKRSFRRFAPTWFASPWRRLIQTACFLAYLVLLFYVCFPYTARPARVWSGWTPKEVDAQTGRAVVAGEGGGGNGIAGGQTLHGVDASATPPARLGEFRVTAVEKGQVVLEPLGERTPERLDRLAASFGPWTLLEDAPEAWPSHYTRDLASKERIPAEIFLALDPLVSLSTAIAARSWVWSLPIAGLILLACLVVPRGFCGYVCPFGTLIDVFDWLVSRRIRKFPRSSDRNWWAKIKYGMLAAVVAASVCGVLLSGFVAAIPVVTRGLVFIVAPLQTGLVRGWHQVPPLHAGHYLSVMCFLAILALGLIRPRFWCKYVCPSGAVFSLSSPFRTLERKVSARCTNCGKCVQVCPFDAIASDIGTRTADCTLCRTCGGVCPVEAIRYAPRWSGSGVDKMDQVDPEGNEKGEVVQPALGRRGFLSAAAGITLGATAGAGSAGGMRSWGAGLNDPSAVRPVRPPGSVPEREFLRLCIRCGECFRACPNDALQPLGFQQGLDGLWTPRVAADWSGCEPSCANCGQVCPTGAIRALPLEEKRAARIGLAVVNRATCLPYAGIEDCRLCVDECQGAGYDAIEFLKVGTKLNSDGSPIEESGFLAPVVLAEKCVGCGLCQTRCGAINAVQKQLLADSAIRIEAGEGQEDRLRAGSYASLRQEEARRRREQQEQRGRPGGQGGYLPDGL